MRACRKGQQNYSTGISEPLTAALQTRAICKTQLVQFPNHGGAEGGYQQERLRRLLPLLCVSFV